MTRFLGLALCAASLLGCSTGPNTASVQSPIDKAKAAYEFELQELQRLDEANRPITAHYNAVRMQDIENHRELAQMRQSNPESAKIMDKMAEDAQARFDEALAERKAQYERVQAALRKVRELQK